MKKIFTIKQLDYINNVSYQLVNLFVKLDLRDCTNEIIKMTRVRLLTILFLSISCIVGYSQNLTDVARSKSLTWYGTDFSECRFINFGLKLSDEDVKNKIMHVSALTYDFQQLLERKYDKKVDLELSFSSQKNEATAFKSRIVSQSFDINEDDIKKLISTYDIKGQGYGVVFIVEGMEYLTNTSYVWAAFINKSDKRVISARRFVCNEIWSDAIKKTIKLSGQYLKSYK